MLNLIERITDAAPPEATLTLPFEQRQKSRFRAQLDNGEDVGVILERGQVLRGGDLLRADSGKVVMIQAAAESVSSVYSDDAHLLSRASYHLGNRHVPLQINPGCLRYQHDHVLDDMVRGLGLSVEHEHAPFEPESGAYAQSAHTHSHHHHD